MRKIFRFPISNKFNLKFNKNIFAKVTTFILKKKLYSCHTYKPIIFYICNTIHRIVEVHVVHTICRTVFITERFVQQTRIEKYHANTEYSPSNREI